MISDKNISEKSLVIGLFATAVAAILLTTGLNNSSNQVQAQEIQSNNTIRVEAGGGNSTAPLTVYVPQNIQIKPGQAINWFNPTPVGEPHSVTILKNSSLFPPFAAPFAVPNST